MLPRFRWFAVLGISCVLTATNGAAQAPKSLPDSAFAALSLRLSEASGFFDTDNLISNEDSYLHPITTLRRLGIVGGTYIGVGPDQNFSYIAQVRPSIAFILDIRRDNLLEHLLFKAAFAESRTRADYLAILFGRPVPADSAAFVSLSIDSILARSDRTRADSASARRARARVMDALRRSGFPLSDADRATISRFHDAFIADGPALQFNTFGRAPQSYYPDFRRLVIERDKENRQASFLATEANFRVVRDLQVRNLIVPLVGNFAGPKALNAVADWMKQNGELLSAFYTSNVEQYLYRDGGFAEFSASVEKLPRRSQAVFIRSCFVCRGAHPERVAGYYAVLTTQYVDAFVTMRKAGQLTQYLELVSAPTPP
jgi:hypothetical protein